MDKKSKSVPAEQKQPQRAQLQQSQRLMDEFARHNAKAAEIVDEIVDAECGRQEVGKSESSREFDRTAEMFAIHSLIIGESERG